MKHHAPAADRNKDAILSVLQELLPEQGVVLEVASGSGQHALYFAEALANYTWLPTDMDPKQLASIAAWREDYLEGSRQGRGKDEEGAALLEPRHLDVMNEHWGMEIAAEFSDINAVVNINMVHISPWAAAEGLFKGCQALLKPGGLLFMYGPFMRDGLHTAPSNADFDDWLKTRDPAWGVRDLSQIEILASQHDFALTRSVEMPANNLSLIFEKLA